jgi:hypothetical protein
LFSACPVSYMIQVCRKRMVTYKERL